MNRQEAEGGKEGREEGGREGHGGLPSPTFFIRIMQTEAVRRCDPGGDDGDS